MSLTLLQALTESVDLKVDIRLIKKIVEIRSRFMTRNEDHLNFFTSNLLGVYPVRYLPSDRARWFEEIMQVDEDHIRTYVVQCDYLDPDWVRANDIVNISSIWLLYRVYTEKNLTEKDRELGLKNTLLLLQYKFISSIMAHYFPYPADKGTATATYEALTRKFEIRQHGSWQGLLEHRTKMILQPDGIHEQAYTTFGPDDRVVYMLSDVQQRLRDVVKKYRAVFETVRQNRLKIASSSSTIEFDGQTEILERTRDYNDYIRYLNDVLPDKATFIREELVKVILDAMHTMRESFFRQVLVYCCENAGRYGDPNVGHLVEETLLHAYAYLNENRGVMSNPSDLAGLLSKFKNLYSASRMSNPQLIRMRDLSIKIAKKALRTRNQSAIAAVRTGLQLYIVLRAFTKKHYEQ